MDSHMQVLATHFSTVYNTKHLDPYLWNHTSCNCLFLRQWCRNVASGADRDLDIGLLVVKAHPFVSVLFREAFSHPYISFFHLLINGFSVTSFRTFFADPLPSFNWWALSLGEKKIIWRQLAYNQLMSQQRPHFSAHSKAKANYKITNLRKIGN